MFRRYQKLGGGAGRNGRRIQTEAAISAQRNSTASTGRAISGSLGFIV